MIKLSLDFTNFFVNTGFFEKNDKYLICVNCKGYSKNKVYKVAKTIDKISYDVFYNFSEMENEYFSFYASDESDVSSFFDEFMNIYNSLDVNKKLTLKDDRDFYCKFLSCGSTALRKFLEFSYDNDISILFCYHKSSFSNRLGIAFDIEEAYFRNYNFFDLLDIDDTIILFSMDRIFIYNLEIPDDDIFYEKLNSSFRAHDNIYFNFLEMYDFLRSFSVKKVDDEYIVCFKLYDANDKDRLCKIIKTCIDYKYIVLNDYEDFGFKVKSLEEIDDKFLEFKKFFEKTDYADYDEVNNIYKTFFKTESNISDFYLQ